MLTKTPDAHAVTIESPSDAFLFLDGKPPRHAVVLDGAESVVRHEREFAVDIALAAFAEHPGNAGRSP
jgi:hypothetical protein